MLNQDGYEPLSRSCRYSLETMVVIPAGKFQMGSAFGGPFEKPVHSVSLQSFYLDRYLVTNASFEAFVSATGYRTEAERSGSAWGYQKSDYSEIKGLSWRQFACRSRENHPVVLISWNDADAFARWAGKRLPTEAEWEYVARWDCGDSDFPWGDATPDGSQCNFSRTPAEIPPTTPVGRFPSNTLGVYDLVGNVWQWCADWYSDIAYDDRDASCPYGPSIGELKVRRGGAWNVIQPFRLRCANRGAAIPTMAVTNLGFRCAVNL